MNLGKPDHQKFLFIVRSPIDRYLAPLVLQYFFATFPKRRNLTDRVKGISKKLHIWSIITVGRSPSKVIVSSDVTKQRHADTLSMYHPAISKVHV